MKRKHDVGEKGVLDTPTHSELSDLISRYSSAREAQPGDRKYCTVTSVESEQGNSEKYNNIQKQKKESKTDYLWVKIQSHKLGRGRRITAKVLS